MTTPTSPQAVTLAQALAYWFKLGFISFGGPAGQIAMMHAELVERRRWISEQRFLHALNYCMLLPGPEATQLAVYIGWLMHRTVGGVLAGALFVLPSLAILILLSWIYLAYGSLPVVAGVLYGIKPAVVAIVLAAAWRLGSRSLKNGWLIGIAVAALLAIGVLQLPFPAIVLGAALIGIVGGRLLPQSFQPGGAHGAAAASTYGPAIIDDTTPPPPHARFSWARLALVLAIGIALGLAVWTTLALLYGRASPLAQMGWFFTKAAMLTFGGAYAVLPYVYQGGVQTYQWLSAAQMIDGLALGETTPGPLIMIVAFVGFVGGWSKMLFGPDHLLLAGTTAACVVAFFTFLPSFIFILAGGPLVESTHGKLHFTAPLAAITAAVVGVIASLALFFIAHVAFPTWAGAGFPSNVEWPALALMLLAGVALLRYKVGVIAVIGVCALAGLLLRWSGFV